VFVSSHLLAEAEHLVDDVIVVNQGRLVITGPLGELQQPASLVRTPSTDALATILSSAGGVAERRDHDTLVVRGISIDEIGKRAFHAGIELHQLSSEAGSLEDLFLDWTSGNTPTGPNDIETKDVQP
jgi:ABC-2 type transport system ATP-binding protein